VAHQELDEVVRVDHCEPPALHENQTRANLVPKILLY